MEKELKCRPDEEFDTYDFHGDCSRELDEESRELSYVLQKVRDQRVIVLALRVVNYEGYDASEKMKLSFWREICRNTHNVFLNESIKKSLEDAASDKETGKKLLTSLLRWSKENGFVRKDIVRGNLPAVAYVSGFFPWVTEHLMAPSKYEKFDSLDEERVKHAIQDRLPSGYNDAFENLLKGKPVEENKKAYIERVVSALGPQISKIL